MLNFDINSWHYRLVRYTYWYGYTNNETRDRLMASDFTNLCPYMRAVLVSMLIFPATCVWNQFPESLRGHSSWVQAFFVIALIATTVHLLAWRFVPTYEWWHTLAWVGGMAGGASGFLGLIALVFWFNEYNDRKRRQARLDGTHSPNILKEYIKAKHDKVCPQIKFTDSDNRVID